MRDVKQGYRSTVHLCEIPTGRHGKKSVNVNDPPMAIISMHSKKNMATRPHGKHPCSHHKVLTTRTHVDAETMSSYLSTLADLSTVISLDSILYAHYQHVA